MAHFDASEYEEMRIYFSASGTWRPTLTIGATTDSMSTSRYRPGRVMRHVITNMRTTRLTDTTAIVESYFTVYLREAVASRAEDTQGTAPSAVGRYTDRLERQTGVGASPTARPAMTSTNHTTP